MIRPKFNSNKIDSSKDKSFFGIIGRDGGLPPPWLTLAGWLAGKNVHNVYVIAQILLVGTPIYGIANISGTRKCGTNAECLNNDPENCSKFLI